MLTCPTMPRAAVALVAVAALAAVGLRPAPAHATFIKQGMLERACASRSGAGKQDCDGYVAGIADTLSGAAQSGICITDQPLAELREKVARYLHAHHGDPSDPAAPAVREALRAAYPCGK